MNFRLSLDDLVHVVTTAETSVLLYDEELADRVASVRSELSPVEHYFSTGDDPDLGDPFATLGADAPATTPDDGDVAPTDLAVMMHTSGTTGRPKLVETDHRSVWANAMACLAEFDFRHTDRSLHVAPMFHSADYLNVLLPSVLAGAANVMQPRFDPERTLDLLESESITLTLGVPTHLKRLKDAGADGYDCSSLRLVMSSGAPVPDDVAETLAATADEARDGIERSMNVLLDDSTAQTACDVLDSYEHVDVSRFGRLDDDAPAWLGVVFRSLVDAVEASGAIAAIGLRAALREEKCDQ
jgi:acyl-CoA synthetase (AMP-forming)/AMP-acid ligase II